MYDANTKPNQKVCVGIKTKFFGFFVVVVAIFYYYYVLLPFVGVFLGLFFFLREAFWLCGLWFPFFRLFVVI